MKEPCLSRYYVLRLYASLTLSLTELEQGLFDFEHRIRLFLRSLGQHDMQHAILE